MSSPVIPPPLEALRNRPFSFYPAILNVEHNKWQYRKATWSDVLVVDARTGQEIGIPRRFLGEISRIEDPVVIVGLLKELERSEERRGGKGTMSCLSDWSSDVCSSDLDARTGQEIGIPRRFLGEISRIEDPVVIVGLLKELEYKEGAVWPYQRRVIEMPI